MDRREFLRVMLGGVAGVAVGTLSACGKELPEALKQTLRLATGTVTLYDTNAMALYFDGGLGPKTGIIRVAAIIENKPVPFKFWHGHGGKDHQFTVLPEHFAGLKQLKRVTIETSAVDGHSHKLFIDPVNPKYRVAGAQPVIVTVGESTTRG